MNLANKLTLSRIAIIPFFIFFLLYEELGTDLRWVAGFRITALCLFILAGITDAIDGIVARKYNLVTNVGRLFDPLADKLLISAAFISFVELNIFPAWIVILILSREFLITGLRSLGTMEGRVIYASRWGKHKTFWQILTVLVALIYLCGRDLLTLQGTWATLTILNLSLDLICKNLLRILIYLCAFFTILSGLIYLVKNKDLLVEAKRQ
ncbi:CDP-diacylglycerol--glycerol-3-phosphate 3-phosphatidyltransferase [Candidatus Sumerlaeota bacterium]|nr:CDP-diacylglycerol--glycerol-3-phosphate 3-phosphatidyltransferase [Candidatus Sumerlaeota bacterium]